MGGGNIPATIERGVRYLLGAALDRLECGTAQKRCDLADGSLRVTHQPGDVIPKIERVTFIRHGRIVADGSKAQLFTSERLQQLFGVPVEVRAEGGYYYVR